MVEAIASNFGQTLSTTVSEYSVRILVGAIIVSGLIIFLASTLQHRYHFTKKAFFTLISGIVIATTAAFGLIHLTAMNESESGSIERREARFVISVCEQQIPILSSDLFSSATGSARQKVFDEGRFEYLGYVTDPERDVSLGSFFQAFGGSINASVMTLPYPKGVESRLANSATLAQFIKTNPIGERYLELKSGSSCDIFPSMISAYTYRYDAPKNAYEQARLTQPENFVISSKDRETMDCIVVIYGEPSESTNLRCGEYPDADRITTKPSSEAGKL